MARPTKITYKIIKEFKKWLLMGNYPTRVCEYLGISDNTYRNWLAWGEKVTDAQARRNRNKWWYRKFYREISKINAEAEIKTVAVLRAYLQENPEKIADFMARRWGERWAKHSTLTQQGQIKVKVEIIETVIHKIVQTFNEVNELDTPDERRQRFAERLARLSFPELSSLN